MPRYAPNKMPASVKRQYFELIRAGVRVSVAVREVGVSLSCGSVWFVEAGRVHVIERPISHRYLNQDDRIEIAEGLVSGDSVKVIATRIGKSYQSVYREIAETFRELPAGLRRTLTWDQGNEMFYHDKVERRTGLKIYFADPHSPWQRGTNENTNGLLREYLPKGTDVGKATTDELDAIATELNSRPRLCLSDRTPSQEIGRWKRRVAADKIRDDH